jgi:hypothetical protein
MTRNYEYAVESYARNHIEFWSQIIGKLSNKDIHLLLDLKVYPSGIESMLMERKMYAELVKLYLDGRRSVADAISLSNFALEDNFFEKHAKSLV